MVCTYITAENARKLVEDAKSLNGEFLKEETIDILKTIEVNATIGKEYVWYDKEIRSVIVDRLKSLGYKVKIIPDHGSTSTEISW